MRVQTITGRRGTVLALDGDRARVEWDDRIRLPGNLRKPPPEVMPTAPHFRLHRGGPLIELLAATGGMTAPIEVAYRSVCSLKALKLAKESASDAR